MQHAAYKRCPRCDRVLPFDQGFAANRSASSGRSSWCRDCVNTLGRRWHAERQAGRDAARRAEEERCIADVLTRVPADFGNWLAGFVDGEGCFSIRYRRDNHTYGCAFVIALRDDDAAVVQQIRDITDIGQVRFRKRYLGTRGFDTKPGVHWIVAARLDCLRLAAMFDRYPLRAKKARDFAIWREAVAVWRGIHQGGHDGRNAARWTRMGELKTTLSEVRSYQGSVLLIPEPVEANAVPAGDDLSLF